MNESGEGQGADLLDPVAAEIQTAQLGHLAEDSMADDGDGIVAETQLTQTRQSLQHLRRQDADVVVR